MRGSTPPPSGRWRNAARTGTTAITIFSQGAYGIHGGPRGAESRYQGIVELKGKSIVDAVQHYFTQSEQIKTSFRLAVHPQENNWRTGGIMIQQLPDAGAGKGDEDVSVEDWTRAALLLSTCSEGELLSPVLHSADILYRLFHEDGVRVTSPMHIRFGCRCTRAR